jgi:hypothetical protein
MTLKKDSNSVAVAGGVSDLDGATILPFLIDHTTGRLLISATISGGLGFQELTATGIVNGSNTSFTFTKLPKYVVSDGAVYKQLDSNDAANWSWNAGTLTATLTVPPQSAIFGWA